MPSTTRRSVLASLGTIAGGAVAGCSSVGPPDPPAGSLRFVNDHSVPHSITMRVVDVGSAPGDGPETVASDPDTTVPPTQRRLTSSTVAEPGETETYRGVFTEPVWCAVRFAVDGREPENDAGKVAFDPALEDGERGSVLEGRVCESGEFSWIVSSTGNPGPFDS